MSLDEIEKLAKGYVSAHAMTGNTGSGADKIARALLALLPLARAAEEWRDYGPGQGHCEEEDCPCTSATCRLKNAIATARSAMGRG